LWHLLLVDKIPVTQITRFDEIPPGTCEARDILLDAETRFLEKPGFLEKKKELEFANTYFSHATS
jgi:hypothetical protein